MTTTSVGFDHGIPVILLDWRKMTPVTAYVGPDYLGSFKAAGIELYTFTVPGLWWVGPRRYDFSAVDAFLENYTRRIPGRYFMPRMDLSGQGFPWWGELHPAEMNVLLNLETGQPADQTYHHPRTLHYLGHEVNLAATNLHSFYSQAWRAEAGQAVADLVAHCEAQPYAGQIWGWHLCDGLFQEWFHWNEYSFEGVADYSPAAQEGFRAWLKEQYQGDVQKLSQAWGRAVDFEDASIPAPAERFHTAHGDFLDPVADRPTADYHQSFSDAIVDSITAVCAAARSALPRPKLITIFYGYQMINMPRPQLCGHYALRRLLDSPVVDAISCPHSYSNRGEGGYHAPQTVADTVRRAGKVYFDEIDCKTAWTPESVTWKRHISQPRTAESTIEMMKKDAAYQIAAGTAQWWMDLTNNGWFDVPELVEPLRRLKAIEERLQQVERAPFAEVAFVSSQRSMMFQACSEGLHNIPFKLLRNWHMGRMGAPFEQILIDDLARPGLPAYKLYIMANLGYVSTEERLLIERAAKRDGAALLWLYAAGYLDDRSASLDNMTALTGFRFGLRDIRAEMDVALTNTDHAITRGLEPGFTYGTGVDREQYQRPPRIQFMPETAAQPAFFVSDPGAEVLGTALSTGGGGLAVKDMGGWRSLYSSTPLLPWPLLRNICRWAGVHVYDEAGDMLWGNQRFLAIYSQSTGPRAIRFPRPLDLEDAYTGETLGRALSEIVLDMQKWETKLLLLQE